MAAVVTPIVVVGVAMVPWWHTDRGGRGVVAMSGTVAVTAVCRVCSEPVVKRDEPFRGGWALAVVDGRRLLWQHVDGEPLCPVMTGEGYAPSLPATTYVMQYIVTYDPWEDDQDEPVKNGTECNVYPCEGDEDMSSVEQAIEVMQYVTDASNYPWQPGSWYSEETYIHPYTGEREEKTYHLNGFTDDQQHFIWNMAKGA